MRGNSVRSLLKLSAVVLIALCVSPGQVSADLTVNIGSDLVTDEGTEVVFSASVDGASDPVKYDWDFGDGITIINTVANPTHVYADNGIYNVTLSVTDSTGTQKEEMLIASVNNVAPTLDAVSDIVVTLGQMADLNVSFNDKGTLDTHTGTFDWGDGSITSAVVTESPFGPPGSTDGMNGAVSGSHLYSDLGTYFATVSVLDDEGDYSAQGICISVVPIPGAVLLGMIGLSVAGFKLRKCV